jgi:hypothetical protein
MALRTHWRSSLARNLRALHSAAARFTFRPRLAVCEPLGGVQNCFPVDGVNGFISNVHACCWDTLRYVCHHYLECGGGTGQPHRSFSQDIDIIAWCSNGFLVLFFLNNSRDPNPLGDVDGREGLAYQNRLKELAYMQRSVKITF